MTLRLNSFFCFCLYFCLTISLQRKNYLLKINSGLPTGHHSGHPLDKKQTFFNGGPSRRCICYWGGAGRVKGCGGWVGGW